MNKTKTPEILWKALRQYRHNYGSEEFIFGFDCDLTIAVVEGLQKQLAAYEKRTDPYAPLNIEQLHDMAGVIMDQRMEIIAQRRDIAALKKEIAYNLQPGRGWMEPPEGWVEQ